MKSLLVRQHNRLFSLLRYEPIIETVAGTDHTDIYVRYGDPIGFRNMCEAGTSALLGSDASTIIGTGASLEVETFIIPRKNMTPELRKKIIEAQRL